MSQIASFYLLKDDQSQELSNGNCSGEVYMAIWDWCEDELDIDVRFYAPQTEDVLDCALIHADLAAALLAELHKQELSELATQLALEWDFPAEWMQKGLETLLSSLQFVQGDTALLYKLT